VKATKLTDHLNGSGRRFYRAIREAMVHPLVYAYRSSRQAETIRADVARWCELLGVPGHGFGYGNNLEAAMRTYLASVPEFRNLFYYRLSAGGGWPATVAMVSQVFWRPLDSFEINCASIGPGLVVAHGYGAILTAERIGANCTLHQQVTVGWRSLRQRERVFTEPLRPPILGDNVFLGTGAKVLGGISIGNNVLVGANAVVISDVPDGFTAVGVPARLLPAPEDTPDQVSAAP
jgi:serine O-acetyltransferase